MASSLSTTASPSASAVTKISSYLPLQRVSTVSFRLSPKPQFGFLTTRSRSGWKCSTVLRAQSNEVRPFQLSSLEDLFSTFRSFLGTLLESSVAFKVAVDGSSNAAAAPSIKTEVPTPQTKDSDPSNESFPVTLATEESISEFISQVSSLVKLVDSRDIVELQLKQLDCEILIRKKEALPQPAPPAPVQMMQSFPPQTTSPHAYQSPPPVPAQAPAAPPAPSSAPSASAAKPAKSSLPPFKCPMAGTFYRSPAPGEPPFVKVGDKVQKGQVVCIIEAMKLMNEIEADQSGTIVEIIAEDRKPVSVDSPLFVIQP